MRNRTQPKILFVNFSRTWGGGEKWHLAAAQALHRRGRGAVVVAHRKGVLGRLAVRAGLPCVLLSMGPPATAHPWSMARLAAYLLRQRPAAVVLNGSRELKTAGTLAKAVGVPRIVYRRGLPLTIRPSWLNRLLFTQVVTDIVVNSSATHSAFQALTAVPGCAPITRIANGLDVRACRPADYQSRRIGIVGRLSPEKGVDIGLQAFEQITRVLPDSRLRIIGGGPERERLEALCQRLQIAHQVEFTGFVNDVDPFLQECALLMLPSRWEGFPNVLLEAMQLGMPCVAFDLAGVSDIIHDGETGRLVRPMDIAQLADRTAALLGDPALMQRMGRAGYERLCGRFALRHSMDRLERLLGLSNRKDCRLS